MMRIGHGYDVHKLVEGRKLILGGVEIPNGNIGLLATPMRMFCCMRFRMRFWCAGARRHRKTFSRHGRSI